MTYTFKLSRRIARLRAPLVAVLVFALSGCNSTDSLNPDSSSPAEPAGQGSAAGAPSLATSSFAGGIPIGTSAQPTSVYGDRYNGALRNIWPGSLLSELAAIKSRGGKVVLMFAGNEQYYKDASGHFSLTLWKQRIDRFRSTNFSSYISDGTIIGHYLIDEPQDPTNWNGVPIAPSTVDAMGQYSKGIWPNLVTIVRTEPRYFTSNPQYVDAAWAQYLARRGDPYDYINRNVSEAQSRGLGLIVGLNLIDGGNPNGTWMSASEVQTYGSALLSSSYPCAFISWQYNSSFLATSGMASAMDVLRQKAQNRSSRSCLASSQAPIPDPVPPPPPPPTPTPTPTPTPGVDGALPFGVSLTPADQWSTRWTGSVYRADPADLVSRLQHAQTAKMNIIVALASPAQSKNADGTFSLTKWKAQVDRFRSLSLGSYISSKALYLHHLVDAPNCASCWGGTAIPWATVEEMAKYSKSIWPSLPTTARVAPSSLAGAGFQWTYLDAGWAQYNTRQGDPSTWLAGEAAQARAEGLGLIAGLNLLHASGPNTAPMTASQIKAFGTVLATNPSVCAVVGWRYDPTYLSQSGIGAALDSVATVAKSRAAASCVAG
jgi:hypothetical protein